MRKIYMLGIVAMLAVLPARGGDDDLKKKIKALEEVNKQLQNQVDNLEKRIAQLEKKLNGDIQERRKDDDRGHREESRDRAADTFLFMFKDGSALPVLSYETKTEREFGMFGKEKTWYYITLESGEVAKADSDKVKEIRRVAGRRN